jgi:hypothetical protein
MPAVALRSARPDEMAEVKALFVEYATEIGNDIVSISLSRASIKNWLRSRVDTGRRVEPSYSLS